VPFLERAAVDGGLTAQPVADRALHRPG
jgi:hypothetical protein